MGVNVKLGALPTLCTILPACPASSPPPFPQNRAHAGLAEPRPTALASICSLTLGLVFSQAIQSSTHHAHTPYPFRGTLPILCFPKPLPSSLEQPPGCQSHRQAEGPASSQAQTLPCSNSWM